LSCSFLGASFSLPIGHAEFLERRPSATDSVRKPLRIRNEGTHFVDIFLVPVLRELDGAKTDPPIFQIDRERHPAYHQLADGHAALSVIDRGRNPTADVPGDFATYRGTAAGAAVGTHETSDLHASLATNGRSASECRAKWPDRPSNAMQEPAMPEVALISDRDF
jgi:hypothetical protein